MISSPRDSIYYCYDSILFALLPVELEMISAKVYDWKVSIPDDVGPKVGHSQLFELHAVRLGWGHRKFAVQGLVSLAAAIKSSFHRFVHGGSAIPVPSSVKNVNDVLKHVLQVKRVLDVRRGSGTKLL